jgi:hypothetical protein
MRWVSGIFFSVVGVLLLTKGLHLRSIGLVEVDGNGIGVYFLGMEINEKVAAADIISYANGFLGSGTIFLLLAVCLFVILLKEKSTFKPLQKKNQA